MCHMIVAISAVVSLLQLQSTVAQIPRVCADTNSLETLTCCPSTTDGVCGGNSNRGQCIELDLSGYSRTTGDVRENWPHYFTQVCSCNGNYAGYDCSRCKYGYFGSDCSQKQVLPRRDVATFSDDEWDEYNEILNLTRYYDSGYVVVLKESFPGIADLQTTNVSIYFLYIWMHHYAAKDSSNRERIVPTDYGHSAPGFTTWHRHLGLWFEWEIQGMLQAMGRQDYHMFRTAYWDWRSEIQATSGISSDDLFTENRLGVTVNVGGSAQVRGSLYGDGWETACFLTFGDICDPGVSTGPLQRCPFTGTDPCSSTNPDWPSLQEVNTGLEIPIYDAFPYNLFSMDGFRIFQDFDVGVTPPDECRNNRMCFCIPSRDCTEPIQTTIAAHWHFRVHTIIGRGDFNYDQDPLLLGTFDDVAASPNDPVFPLHHNMIDCIFIEWLRRYPNASYPTGSQNAGHFRDEYLVPFFPLYTHADMFKHPEEFGYTCNLSNLTDSASTPPDSGSNVATFSLGLLLFASILATLFA